MKYFFLLFFFSLPIQALTQTPIKIPQGIQHSEQEIDVDDWNLIDYQFKVDELQTKIDIVSADPEQKAKAEASGWFKTAYAALKSARFERDTHIKKYNYKKVEGFPEHQYTGNRPLDDARYEKELSTWINAHPNLTKDNL